MSKGVEKRRAAIRSDVQPLVRRGVPPLENGDRLSQKEFHRRYEAMPDVRAELIGGIVFMSSPAFNIHSEPLTCGSAWLVHYEAATPGLRTWGEQSLILDTTNEVQPDVALGILPEFGGHAILKKGYLIRAPELVLEVANTSANIDLNSKFETYRRNNVQEYVVHLARDKAVKWFVLRNGIYEPLLPDRDGIIRSIVFPGLWLHVKALVKRDLPTLFRTLDKGTATGEHAAFCKRLRDAVKKLKRQN